MGVTGLPAEGAVFALPIGAYGVDIDGNGDGWVRVTASGAAGRVDVTFMAGLATGWAGQRDDMASRRARVADERLAGGRNQRGYRGRHPAAQFGLPPRNQRGGSGHAAGWESGWTDEYMWVGAGALKKKEI